MTELVVEVNKLSRSFGNVEALDRVDFRATRGQVYGLVGANGAGKTTFIKHLLGLLRAKSGSVKIFSSDPVLNPQEVLKRIGYLSEERDLPDWMSIDELMRFTSAFYKGWDQDYAYKLLNNFTLDPKQKIKNLSRGMRAQVALIAAVAHRPDLLILDEPSSGLDAIVRQDILNAVVRTISEEGRTVIFSSHLLDEVERLSDHVTMIDNGRVVLDSSLQSLNAEHHFSNIKFIEHLDGPPELTDILSLSGSGRSWNVIHEGSPERLSNPLNQLGGEVIESRSATLEEIFVARVGRESSIDQAELT